jgi:hypothetical protein
VLSPNMTAVTFWRSHWSMREDRATLLSICMARRGGLSAMRKDGALSRVSRNLREVAT